VVLFAGAAKEANFSMLILFYGMEWNSCVTGMSLFDTGLEDLGA
jgi:hypothetical protein